MTTPTEPILLTDSNIELILGQMRGMLQKNQHRMEGDLLATPDKRLEVPFTLTLSANPAPGHADLKIDYWATRRTDKSRIALEDRRQMALLTPNP